MAQNIYATHFNFGPVLDIFDFIKLIYFIVMHEEECIVIVTTFNGDPILGLLITFLESQQGVCVHAHTFVHCDGNSKP